MSHPFPLDDGFLPSTECMRHDQALAVIRRRVSPVVGTEAVALDRAVGRLVARAVTAPRPVPAADNAAVDGYAFAHADYIASGGRLPVSVRLPAGRPAALSLARGSAARIFTGAAMPAGADSVAMQEDCRLEEVGGVTTVVMPNGLKPGANRRRAGEDLESGAIVVAAGDPLRPQDIAAIASTGAAHVFCFAPLKVAFVSTGNEVLPPGAPFEAGTVYDANRPMLASFLTALPVVADDLGILPDRPEAVRDVLERAARGHDAIIVTGGAGPGDEDHVAEVLGAIGKRHVGRIAIKPGRPVSFGQIGDCALFGLPGNPVAVFVCFALYVRPALLALAGAAWREPRRLVLEAAFSVPRKKTGRREFLRGILLDGAGGMNRVAKFPRDGSGLITGLREADGLIELGEDVSAVAEGDAVRFISFGELGLPPRWS